MRPGVGKNPLQSAGQTTTLAPVPRQMFMARPKRDAKRNLYYVYPVSGKALKKRYYRLLAAGVVTGLLIGGLLAAMLWLLNRH